MKDKLNAFNVGLDAKVCVLAGYYDEDGHYDAVCADQVTLGDLISSISSNVRLEHDINIYINPRTEVVVFAKSRRSVERYLKIKGGPDYLKELLESFDQLSDEIDHVWTTYDFPSFI